MSITTRYYLKLWFYSKDKPTELIVSKYEWERFESIYSQNDADFFVCNTTDGKYIAINLGQVVFAHLLWDSGIYAVLEETNDGEYIVLTFVDREPVYFDIDDPVEIGDIFFTLDANVVSERLSFLDCDGERLIFDPDKLLFLEANAAMVEEGQELSIQESKFE